MQKLFKNVKQLKNIDSNEWKQSDIVADFDEICANFAVDEFDGFVVIPSFKNHFLNLLNLSSSQIEERIFANIKAGVTDFIVLTDNFLVCKYLFEKFHLDGKIALMPDFDFDSIDYSSDKILVYVDPYTMEENVLDEASDIAAKKGYKVVIRLFDNLEQTGILNSNTGQLPISYIESFGLLDRGGYISGAICSDKEDYRILSGYEFSIITRPIADLRKGNGFANIVQICNAELGLSVGSDDEEDMNMFSYMRTLMLGTRGLLCNENALTEEEAFKILANSNDKSFIVLDKQFNSVKDIVNKANNDKILMVVSNGKVIYFRGEENAN